MAGGINSSLATMAVHTLQQDAAAHPDWISSTCPLPMLARIAPGFPGPVPLLTPYGYVACGVHGMMGELAEVFRSCSLPRAESFQDR